MFKRILIGVLVLVWGNAQAGVVFEVETTDHSGSQRTDISRMLVEGLNLKMEMSSGDDSDANTSREGIGVSIVGSAAEAMSPAFERSSSRTNNPEDANDVEKDYIVYNGERREISIVDHARREYIRVNSPGQGTVSKETPSQPDLMSGLEGLLGGLSDEQKEALKGMGDLLKSGGAEMAKLQRATNKREFRRTGERGTKQGYPCVKYEVLMNGRKVQELWVTDWSNLTGGGDVRNAFKGIDDILSGGFGGGLGDGDSVFQVGTQLGGFPVVTRDFDEYDGSLESETVLESVTERDLDPDAFEPPKGYRLRTMGPG